MSSIALVEDYNIQLEAPPPACRREHVQCPPDLANYLSRERLTACTGNALLAATQHLECVQLRHDRALSVAFSYPRVGSSIPTASSAANRPLTAALFQRRISPRFYVSAIGGQMLAEKCRQPLFLPATVYVI